MNKIVSTVALCALALGAAGCAGQTSVMPTVRAPQNIAGALPGSTERTPENIAGALPAAPKTVSNIAGALPAAPH